MHLSQPQTPSQCITGVVAPGKKNNVAIDIQSPISVITPATNENTSKP